MRLIKHMHIVYAEHLYSRNSYKFSSSGLGYDSIELMNNPIMMNKVQMEIKSLYEDSFYK